MCYKPKHKCCVNVIWNNIQITLLMLFENYLVKENFIIKCWLTWIFLWKYLCFTKQLDTSFNLSKKHILHHLTVFLRSLNEVWRDTVLITLARHIKSELHSLLYKPCCFHALSCPTAKCFLGSLQPTALCSCVVTKMLLSGCSNSSDCRRWLAWTVSCSLPYSCGVTTQKCPLQQLVYLKVHSGCFTQGKCWFWEVYPHFLP